MRNVAPSRSLARRANQWKTIAFLVAAISVFIATIGVVLFLIPFVNPNSSSYALYSTVIFGVLCFAGLLFLAAIGIAIRAFTWRTDNDLAMITGRYLARSLDDRFTLIRNVSKREIGYIDAVLVGPPGALVMRILDDPGDYLNEGSNWVVRRRTGELTSAKINPTREAVADIRKLREYLAKHRLADVPVYGAVVFTREEPVVRLTVREPTVPPSHLSTLILNLQNNYLAKDRIDADKVTAFVRLLFGE